MGRLYGLFNRFFYRSGKPGARRTPESLSPELKAAALHEARFLLQNAVEIRSLKPGEIPDLPRPAGEEPR